MGYSGALLKNNKGKILFQLRDGNGRNPNKWGIFGGGIKKGEKPINALIREIKEELNLNISKKQVIHEYEIPFVNYHIFEVRLRKIPKKSDLNEGKDMKFMTKKEFFREKSGLLRVKLFLMIFRID